LRGWSHEQQIDEDGASSPPWVHPLEGFAAFKRAGHTDAAHKALVLWDNRRRGKA